MIRRGKQKLQGRRGFTLAETLLSVLLLSIITVAVTAGVGSARNVYAKVRQKADAQTLLSTVLTAMSADLSTASSIRQAEGKVIFTSGSRGYEMYFEDDPDQGILAVSTSGTRIPVVTDKTMTLDLTPHLILLTPPSEGKGGGEAGCFQLTVSVENSSGKEIEKETLYVRPFAVNWN